MVTKRIAAMPRMETLLVPSGIPLILILMAQSSSVPSSMIPKIFMRLKDGKKSNLKPFIHPLKQGCKIPLARSHLRVKCYAGE